MDSYVQRSPNKPVYDPEIPLDYMLDRLNDCVQKFQSVWYTPRYETKKDDLRKWRNSIDYWNRTIVDHMKKHKPPQKFHPFCDEHLPESPVPVSDPEPFPNQENLRRKRKKQRHKKHQK